MNLRGTHRTLPKDQSPTPSRAGCAPVGLPQTLQQGLSVAVTLSMKRLSDKAESSIDMPALGGRGVEVMARKPEPESARPAAPVGRSVPGACDASWQRSPMQPVRAECASPSSLVPSPATTVLEQQAIERDKAMLEVLSRKPSKSKRKRMLVRQMRKDANKQPEVIAYHLHQAELCRYSNIPWDGIEIPHETDGNTRPRERNAYLDLLPKTSLEELQELVDCIFEEDYSPLVVTAVRRISNEADWWRQVTRTDGHDGVRLAALSDAVGHNTSLDAGQLRTLMTLDGNADDFFGSRGLGRDKLQKIVIDTNSSSEIDEATRHQLADPVLFCMLDNTEYGRRSTGWLRADDRRLSRNELLRFMQKMSRSLTSAGGEPQRLISMADSQEAAQSRRHALRDGPFAKAVKSEQAKKIVNGVMRGISFFQGMGFAAKNAVAAWNLLLVSQASPSGSRLPQASSGPRNAGLIADDGIDVSAEAEKCPPTKTPAA